MAPQFNLDLTRSFKPMVGRGEPGTHGALTGPSGEIDPVRGLEFPLSGGGFTFASKDIVDDASGTLKINFTLGAKPSGAVLVQAWGQYEPLLELNATKLLTNIYGIKIPLQVRWQEGSEYTIRLSWDHTAGITLAVGSADGTEQCVRRRLQWAAYRQEYVPFSIGGMATGHRFKNWEGGFRGWIRDVSVWNVPLESPGPISLNERGEALPQKLPSAVGIEVLSLDDPPIHPNPLGISTLPDRLDDLRSTREVSCIDAVTGKAKSEIETFAAITHWVANLWPHCQYWPFPPGESRHIFEKRGHEMIPEIKAGRMGGMCGGYAHVMEELFWSLGYDARRIQVTNHSSFEAYSNELNKWIICDASYNDRCHFFADSNGLPLGADDLLRRHEALAYDPTALDDVQTMICREENLASAGDAADYSQNYDQLGCRAAPDLPRHLWYFKETERTCFGAGDMGIGGDSELVDDLAELYPSRNRVAVEFSWVEMGSVLEARLNPVSTAYFETMLASIDGVEFQPCANTYPWRLHAGVNHLALRTRNKLGAQGYPFRIAVWKKAG